MLEKLFANAEWNAGTSGAVAGIAAILSTSCLTPFVMRAGGFALGSTTGLVITSGAMSFSAVSFFAYCAYNGISATQVLRQLVKNIVTSVYTIQSIKKAKDFASDISALRVAADTGAAAIGYHSGVVIAKITEQLEFKPEASMLVADGASKLVAVGASLAIGGNPVVPAFSIQVGALARQTLEPLLGAEVATHIGAATTLALPLPLNTIISKVPALPTASHYDSVVLIGDGVGKVADGILQRFGYQSTGPIKDGFSFMATTVASTALGVNTYGAVFGLYSSKAASNGVEKLLIGAKFPEQAKAIGGIAGTLATPVLSLTAEAAMQFLQLPGGGAAMLSYGTSLAVEGLIKESKYRAYNKEFALGSSVITSFGGAAITGANPLTLIVGALMNTMVRDLVKKAALTAKCQEPTADTIATATGALAIPMVSMVATHTATEYPAETMVISCAAVLGALAYKHNVYIQIAKSASDIAVSVASNLKDSSNQQLAFYGGNFNAMAMAHKDAMRPLKHDIKRMQDVKLPLQYSTNPTLVHAQQNHAHVLCTTQETKSLIPKPPKTPRITSILCVVLQTCSRHHVQKFARQTQGHQPQHLGK